MFKKVDKLLIITAIIVILLGIIAILANMASVEIKAKSSEQMNKNYSTTESDTWAVSKTGEGSIIATFREGTLTFSGEGKINEFDFASNYPWYNKKNYISKIVISNGIENIPTRAFEDYVNLREVNLGNNIENIGYEAFKGCDSLTSIELPNELTIIDTGAFVDCINLKSIFIPNSVVLIGAEDNEEEYGQQGIYQFDVFRGCIRLENILVGENNEKYSSKDGVLFNKDKTKLIYYPEAKKDLEYTIPSTVKQIGSFSMYNVDNINKINISNGLVKIEYGAFVDCRNLMSINIPKTVEIIKDDVFVRCLKLKSIEVDESNANYSSKDEVLFNKDKTELLLYPIGKEDTEYTIPNTVKTIERGAFDSCSNLTNIEIPNSVVNIEQSAFAGCTGLTEMVIPNSVKKIGTVEIIFGQDFVFNSIFEGCTNLVSVTLPNEIEEFYSENMFSECRKLETVNLPTNMKYIGKNMFFNCNNLESISIPNTVTHIRSSAFLGTNLKNIEIPEGIESIKTYAFSKCRGVTNISIPETVTTIEQGAFGETLLTVEVATNTSETYEIELPEIIQRAKNEEDILYSSSGFTLRNCSWNDNGDKIIVNKEALVEGEAKLTILSGSLRNLSVLFVLEDFQDITPPEVEEISINSSNSGRRDMENR